MITQNTKAFGSQSIGGEMAAAMGMDPRPHMTRAEIEKQLKISGLSETEWNAAWEHKLSQPAPF